MALTQNVTQEAPRAFELKGRMMTFSVLRVLSADIGMLIAQLDAKIATAPALFNNFPVLLDFAELPERAQEAFDIGRFERMLRERSFVPVGLTGAGAVLRGIAAGVGLGMISPGLAAAPRPVSKEAPPASPVVSNILIKTPVRSGQQIYARGGDLTVLATVSSGAEVMADGNIHVYGALRGRALAGANGNAEARIFCMELDAEIVSIAGRYQTSELFPDGRRKHAAQIYLNGKHLIIESI